jgi:flagellar biosynthesis GTPase FlhF
MSKAVLQDDTAYTIEWDDDIEAVVHTWEEFTSGQEFRDGCEALLDAIKRKNADRILVDTRGIQAHDDDDQAWLEEQWVPRVIDAGVSYAATLIPDSAIAEMDMEELMTELEEYDYTTMMTADMDEAREWVASQ